MKNSNCQTIFDALEKQGVQLTPEYKNKVQSKIDNIVSYEPRVGVFGKTGVGKSSLCNALFGRDVCDISDFEACTREPQEVVLSIGEKGLKLLDVPGVGESRDRDQEYAKLYKSLLPELDLIIWVLKGDDRAFTSDESFYKKLVKPYIDSGKSFFMVINQADKIEPFREWDEEKRSPGIKQAQNIEGKRRAVSGYFDLPLDQIIAVSANERFGLIDLVDSIVHSLPDDKKATVLREVEEGNRSKKAEKEADDGLVKTIIDIAVDFLPVPDAVKEPVKKVLKTVSESKIWPWNWF